MRKSPVHKHPISCQCDKCQFINEAFGMAIHNVHEMVKVSNSDLLVFCEKLALCSRKLAIRQYGRSKQ